MQDENDVLVGTDPLQEYATPNPHPSRAVYGFALFLCSWLVLPLYLLWAFVPTSWLEAIHITYVPAKYWAVAIPLLFPIAVSAFVVLIFSINLIRFHGIFDNVEVIENDFGELSRVEGFELNSFLRRASEAHLERLRADSA